MMITDYVEILGFVAASLGTLSFLPQVLKVWKTRSTESISLSMYVIYCLSIVLWLIYGILIKSPPLIVAELATFTLAFAILIMKWLWK